MGKINVKNLGLSLGIVSALCMLVLGIFGNLGIYMGTVNMMLEAHAFFDLSFFGIITGMIEGGIWGFIFGMLIAYFYNLVGRDNEEL